MLLYKKSSRGVIAIANEAGEIVEEYIYDAWGNPTSTPISKIGQFNPFRYRGYIYDEETGFYYLNSRYYDPEIGRFINSDEYVFSGEDVLGHNTFLYCKNNPIMYKDPSGKILITAALIVIGAGVVVVVQLVELLSMVLFNRRHS